MLTALAFVTAVGLVPAQAAQLRLTNDRPTYGIMGATRPDSNVLPGDVFCVTFDIENLRVDADGKVIYRMAMRETNSKGKVQFSRDPQDLEIVNALGGATMPAFAGVEVPTDQPPGEYTLEVTVTDRATKQTVSLTRKFQVLPRGFGLVQVRTTFNIAGDPPAPPVGVAGQTFVVNVGVTGFERGGPDKAPNATVEMQVLDANGQPTLPKPFVGELGKEIPEKFDIVPLPFVLALNRPGKFTVRVRAVDKISNKKQEVTLPLVVYDSNLQGRAQ